MSRERVERLRRNVEGLWKKDLAADVLASIDPAVSIYPPPQWPDQSVYRGPEGAKKLA